MSGACFHCGLPLPRSCAGDGQARRALAVVIDGEPRAMCCPGCVAVAELIVGSGLTDYYRYREEPGANPDLAAARMRDLLRYDHEALQKTFVQRGQASDRTCVLSIEGMRCAACVWLLESRLRALPGVTGVSVNLGAARGEIGWNEDETRLSAILAAVGGLGYVARPYRPDWHENARREEYRSALRRLVVAGLGAMQVMMYSVGLYAGALEGIEEQYRTLLRVVSGLVATPILAYSAWPFFASARRDLGNRGLGMDVPVSLALAIAYGASVYATLTRSGEVYFDSVAMFVFILSVGRFVEMRARQRAAEAVEAALRRPPETATRLVDAGGREIVPVHELAAGDRVLVRPGETFPVDGVVRRGRGWVNESMLTGEHWPRDRREGDEVAAGTQNGESPFVVVASRTGAETTWSNVVRLVDRASQDRPAIARLADRVAHVFVPAVIVASGGTAFAWWLVDPSQAFWIALSVLVITCPCALSLATPAALTAASGGALRRGLLLRTGSALETLQRATHVVFDKTGTLTLGRFRLRSTQILGGMGVAECLAAATALERYSEHPVARAFDDPGAEPVEVDEVSTRVGAGVDGRIRGRQMRIGTHAFAAALSRDPDLHRPSAAPVRHSFAARTPCATDLPEIWLGDEGGLLCRFELEDETRPLAAETVARLRAAGLGVSLVSGDGAAPVKALANRVGIDDAHASCTPEDKLAHVRRLQHAGHIVLMVGDGVNDAPVLGAAQVSIAMGGGTDLARSRADAVLLKEDLAPVADAVDVARAARRVMLQNLGWSLAYNVVALPLACAGLVTPWWAAIGMSVSSLVVVLNAVRLGRPPRAPAGAEAVRDHRVDAREPDAFDVKIGGVGHRMAA